MSLIFNCHYLCLFPSLNIVLCLCVYCCYNLTSFNILEDSLDSHDLLTFAHVSILPLSDVLPEMLNGRQRSHWTSTGLDISPTQKVCTYAHNDSGTGWSLGPTELRIGLLVRDLMSFLDGSNKFLLAFTDMIETAVSHNQQPGLLEVEVKKKDRPPTLTSVHSPFSTFKCANTQTL